MRTHRLRLLSSVGSAALILSLAACAADSNSDPAPESAETPQMTDSAEEPADSTDEPVESAENPIALGFEISGPAGTVVEATTVAMAGGVAQPGLDQTWSLTGEPKWQLFTIFVESAAITLEVTEGGPVTIQGFRGNYKDVNDPMAGYLVSEELSTVDLASGTSEVFNLP